MRVPFIKMHGLGNDFIVLDAREGGVPTLTPTLVAALADRHTGIGCDQLVLLEPSEIVDIKVRFFNQDGSDRRLRQCHARGAYCMAARAPWKRRAACSMSPPTSGISVDMGRPRFDWDAIPLSFAMDTLTLPLGWEGTERAHRGQCRQPACDLFRARCLCRSARPAGL
jgi:diaminopimelate epimerase